MLHPPFSFPAHFARLYNRGKNTIGQISNDKVGLPNEFLGFSGVPSDSPE
jgi:hypothetical protein